MMADGRWLRWLMFDGLERERETECNRRKRGKNDFFIRNCSFFDLTAVNMRKTPYNLYKRCR